MNFLKSLFTEHVATKFMALLLAVVLFLFVQQSITATGDIARIRIEFTLAAAQREQVTLVTKEIVLQKIKIQGEKREVSLLIEQIERNPTQMIEIDARFLARYPGTEKRIPIDADFLREHQVIPEEVKVLEIIGDPRLVIHKNDILTMKLRLAPGEEEDTILKTRGDDPAERKHGYEGTLEGGNKVELSFSMPQVQVRAPRTCFLDGASRPARTLMITIDPVDDFLADYIAQSAQEEVNMAVAGVDWNSAGIHQANFTRYAHFRIGDRWLSYSDFRDLLTTRFMVRQARESLELDLEVVFLTRPDRTLKFLDDYEVVGPEGPVHFPLDFDRKTATGFSVLIPPRFERSDLDTLVLILDIANAKEAGEDILVPVMLGVKDRRREDILSRVQIRLQSGKAFADIRFHKK